MSDCSTNAFKVPDCFEPKTCGNCDHASNYALSCDICGKSRKFQVYHDEPACNHWKECEEISIEQRYQQLEQVAKKMLAWCDFVMTKYRGEGATPYEVNEFRDQLEALGVSLDD